MLIVNTHSDNSLSIQQQQQLYQRMPGMYKSAHGLTLIQGNNMAPRMVYNPVSGQTIMTTQHSAMMGPQQSVMGNNVLVSRSGNFILFYVTSRHDNIYRFVNVHILHRQSKGKLVQEC